MTEHDVQNNIRLELSKHGVKCFRMNVMGSYTQDGRYVPPCVPRGFSDLFGVINGRAFFIEVKSPNGRTEKKHLEEQTAFLKQMSDAGALTGFASSVEEALIICGL